MPRSALQLYREPKNMATEMVTYSTTTLFFIAKNANLHEF